MKHIKPLLPAIGIFCLALVVRIIYNNTVAFHYFPLHDSAFYQGIAFHMLKEHCFCLEQYVPTVDRAPLWPFTIAGLTIIFGPSDYVARIFLSIVGSGTCVLVYLFARDLFSWRIGVIAGAFAAIYPELYIYDGWLYTESLYIFLLFAICYGLYRLQHKPERNWRNWIIIGVLLGLLSLTRPNGIIVIGLFIIWCFIMVGQKFISLRITIRGVLLSTLIAIVLIAPWTIRNYLVSHAFVPVATGDGTVLLGAYNNEVLTKSTYPGGPKGTWINPNESSPDIVRPFPLHTCTPPCEVAREAAFKDAAVKWIETNINIMPHLLKLHFINMWQPDTYEADLPVVRFPHQQSTQLVVSMMKTWPIYLFILAALGLIVTVWRWRELLFIYFMIFLTIAQNVIYYGSARLRAPIEPMLILLAAGFIWWLTHKDKGTLRWMIDSWHNKEQITTTDDDTSDNSIARKTLATKAVDKQRER
jgi:4-amino-4-deoxy-L-arabinose transferase-like glycosyltransferase